MKFGKSKADLPGSSDPSLYENTNILTINTFAGTQITNIEEEDYETIDETIEPIEVRDSHERKKKNASNDTIEQVEVRDSHERKRKSASNDTLKRLKCRFNVMTVLNTVVYITLISLVIFLFVPKSSVDSHWAQWSSWTSCDVTCGNGKHLRLRTCTNQFATTNDCIGESLQIRECTIGNCTVNGQWAYWSSWTSCDVTCGKGRRLRTRRCTDPTPENEGRDCIGESLQSSQCSEENCPAFMSAFSVTTPHSYSTINGIRKLNFSRTIYQYGNDFNISTGTYTCSKSGVYHFSVTLVKKRVDERNNQNELVRCKLYKNRQSLIYIKVDPTDDDTDKGNAAITQSIVINLDVGNTV
ncbi:uncharacterized protein LOC132746607 [Ruditapes philippinarum]|uniref:uncharacterized protein LOC132746607 n=1 Tax=Ruditapes philippinarum TaxID=129788 RepID=UPI00295B2ADA|nr:uncharacterized protein LOC132746607 [Ruditapes philippinarum]